MIYWTGRVECGMPKSESHQRPTLRRAQIRKDGAYTKPTEAGACMHMFVASCRDEHHLQIFVSIEAMSHHGRIWLCWLLRVLYTYFSSPLLDTCSWSMQIKRSPQTTRSCWRNEQLEQTWHNRWTVRIYFGKMLIQYKQWFVNVFRYQYIFRFNMLL